MIKEMIEFNKKFVEDKKYEQYKTSKYPDKKIAILSCMDTRLTELLPAALGIKNGDVKIIKNAGKFEDLSAELKETANLRLLYPEYSLQELGANLSKPIGRSGVNRRFLKLAVIADEIIKKDKDGENIGN